MLATEERSQMKDWGDSKSVMGANGPTESEQIVFKATPLNKKIFERPSRLPEVQRKEKTDFSEFTLSQTNRKSALPATSDTQTKDFKALPLNKKIL